MSSGKAVEGLEGSGPGCRDTVESSALSPWDWGRLGPSYLYPSSCVSFLLSSLMLTGWF